MIQHPKDAARPESTVPGANGSVASPRSTQGGPGQGVRAASPPCLIQRQVINLYLKLEPILQRASYYQLLPGDQKEFILSAHSQYINNATQHIKITKVYFFHHLVYRPCQHGVQLHRG